MEKFTQSFCFPTFQRNFDMMHTKTKNFKFAANEKCQALCIPYKTQNLAMFFILPTERNGLEAFEKEMAGPALIKLLNTVFTTEVEVQLPKFKMEQSFDLVEKLNKLGVHDMFTSKADFSKISGSKDLAVSGVIHKAFIEYNEKGAEAAVVMTVRRSNKSLCISVQRRFIADHPFLFAIVERTTNSLLFLGHYYGQ